MSKRSFFCWWTKFRSKLMWCCFFPPSRRTSTNCPSRSHSESTPTLLLAGTFTFCSFRFFGYPTACLQIINKKASILNILKASCPAGITTPRLSEMASFTSINCQKVRCFSFLCVCVFSQQTSTAVMPVWQSFFFANKRS